MIESLSEKRYTMRTKESNYTYMSLSRVFLRSFVCQCNNGYNDKTKWENKMTQRALRETEQKWARCWGKTFNEISWVSHVFLKIRRAVVALIILKLSFFSPRLSHYLCVYESVCMQYILYTHITLSSWYKFALFTVIRQSLMNLMRLVAETKLSNNMENLISE